MDIISCFISILVGFGLGYALFYLLGKSKSISKNKFDELTIKLQNVETDLRISAERNVNFQTQNEEFKQLNQLKEHEHINLKTQLATIENRLENSQLKLHEISEKLHEEIETNKSQQISIYSNFQKITELNSLNQSLKENLEKQLTLNDQQSLQIETYIQTNSELKEKNISLNAKNLTLNEKWLNQKNEIENLQKTAHLQFEKIANQLLDEKTSKFTETNKTNMEILLNPLKEDINAFKNKVEHTHEEDTKQRISLEERIKGLIEQTNKVSAEANNLATALKGKPQKRGNWGELILERILESSGLTKDREYFIQKSLKDEEGKQLRPDVRVNLPDNRLIIIDSKVSLIAYDKFSACDDIEEQKIYLSEHVKATQAHIDQLSAKKYDNIDQSLDFTMMFIPIEPAYLLAIQAHPDLWTYAYSKRILLVSPTNLIACLKLISDLWKKELQNKNAMEIVKKGEALYEKFVGFTKTFEEIGQSIKNSQDKYDKAIGQLKGGKGNLINQAIQLKNLGLKSEKNISEKLLPINHHENDSH